MKKVYSICMIAMLNFLAVNAQIVQIKSVEKSVEKMQNTSTARHGASSANPHPASIIWSDDFSVASNWVMNHISDSIGDWVIRSTGPDGTWPIGIIGTTPDFALFDSDSICSHDQIANITTVNPIDVTGHSSVRLTFSQYYRRYYDSTYVFISNDGANWTKFEVNANILSGQFSANDINTNPDIVHVDISSAAGNQDSVYVRFQFYNPDTNLTGPNPQPGCGYAWMIDDVSISDIPGTDASLDPTYSAEYCIVPIIQKEAIQQLRGRLINRSTNPITNGKILFNVYDQNGLVFTDSSAASAVIAPGDTSSVLASLNPFLPAATGYFLVEQLVMVPGDGDNTNDTNLVDFFVSDSTMARDLFAIGANTYGGAYGFGNPTGRKGSMGTIFHVYNASSLSSASVYFANPIAGINVSVSVYSVSGGVPDTLMGSSNIYNITSGDTNLTLPFVPSVDVPAGDFFVCINQLDTFNMGLGFSFEVFTPSTGFAKLDTAIAWSSLNLLARTPILRVNNPSGTLLFTEKVSNESPFNVYPNPSAGIIYVAGKGAEKNVFVTVLNSLGQVVKTTHFDTLTINRVDLHNLPAGMYTVNIKSSKGETNKTIILE